MEIIKTLKHWSTIRDSLQGCALGFVPTMGNLHRGHASLIQKSIENNAKTVVSIFVNPTQFNDSNDFDRYPKTFEDDCRLAESLGTDYLFAPPRDTLYPDNYRYRLSEHDFSRTLEGEHRPGHFDGMLTIVLKLFNIIRPNNAYFGEKDRQQLMLVQGMVEALFLDITIVGCPTLRETSGLALSSRNQFLTTSEHQTASHFYTLLKKNRASERIEKELSDLGFLVNYIKDYGTIRFGAVQLNAVRLIDNVELHNLEN